MVSYEFTSMEDLVGCSCVACVKVRECGLCFFQPGVERRPGGGLTRPPAGQLGSARGRASLDRRVSRARHSL